MFRIGFDVHRWFPFWRMSAGGEHKRPLAMWRCDATMILLSVMGARMRIMGGVIAALMLVSSAEAQSIGAGSTWVNDGGSELTIVSISNEGELTGTYVNKVAGFDCQNETMAMKGWLDGNLLSFTVRWKNANKDCASITSWTGYFAAGKIFTDWDLVYTAANTGLPTHLKESNVFRPK
nr:avidin/streptavidin family protein [Sinorhizobium medicae]